MTQRDEQPEDITPLLHDTGGMLARYVSAWPRLPRAGDGEPDHVAIGEILGVSTQNAALMHRRASALGLIYSDGTIHSLARGFLRAKVSDALGRAKPRKP